MWVDVLIENWQATLVGGLLGYTAIKDIWNMLPMNSIKKIFSKNTDNIIGSANIVYKETKALIEKTKVEIANLKEQNKILLNANVSKEQQNEVLASAFVTLLSSMQVPLNAKQNMYQAVKEIDGLTKSSLQALELSIKNQMEQENQVIEEDNELNTLIEETV